MRRDPRALGTGRRGMRASIDLDQQAIDLSMPITEHWRFAPTISYHEVNPPGCSFHSTKFSMGAHGFTHVDAPWHVDSDGHALQSADLNQLWGIAKVIDVTSVGENDIIDAAALQASAPSIDAGDIALIRSSHELRFPTTQREYWTRAPWMGRDAALWLLEKNVRAVGFDFPQDRGIRSDYVEDPWVPGDPLDDWPCHHLLLPRGVFQIEYLQNLAAIRGESCLLFAAPLRFSRSDGSPVRAFALSYSS